MHLFNGIMPFKIVTMHLKNGTCISVRHQWPKVGEARLRRSGEQVLAQVERLERRVRVGVALLHRALQRRVRRERRSVVAGHLKSLK